MLAVLRLCSMLMLPCLLFLRCDASECCVFVARCGVARNVLVNCNESGVYKAPDSRMATSSGLLADITNRPGSTSNNVQNGAGRVPYVALFLFSHMPPDVDGRACDGSDTPSSSRTSATTGTSNGRARG